MNILEELIENLVERNTVKLNGTLAIAMIAGGIAIKGNVFSTLRDQKKNKDILKIEIPVNAEVKVGDIVIPLPQLP
jgi:hypothetical protein